MHTSQPPGKDSAGLLHDVVGWFKHPKPLHVCLYSLAAEFMVAVLNLFGVTCCCCCNCAVVPLACRAMPQYLEKGPDGRRPMDSVLNFPMYYKLNDVFAYQKDMRM